jgi:hypothetical protein
MAMDWQKLISDNGGSRPEAFEGRVEEDAVDEDSMVLVSIGAFANDQTWGPCPWMPRGSGLLPTKGDRCLIVLATTEDPGTPEIWIAAWWPS